MSKLETTNVILSKEKCRVIETNWQITLRMAEEKEREGGEGKINREIKRDGKNRVSWLLR